MPKRETPVAVVEAATIATACGHDVRRTLFGDSKPVFED